MSSKCYFVIIRPSTAKTSFTACRTSLPSRRILSAKVRDSENFFYAWQKNFRPPFLPKCTQTLLKQSFCIRLFWRKLSSWNLINAPSNTDNYDLSIECFWNKTYKSHTLELLKIILKLFRLAAGYSTKPFLILISLRLYAKCK